MSSQNNSDLKTLREPRYKKQSVFAKNPVEKPR